MKLFPNNGNSKLSEIINTGSWRGRRSKSEFPFVFILISVFLLIVNSECLRNDILTIPRTKKIDMSSNKVVAVQVQTKPLKIKKPEKRVDKEREKLSSAAETLEQEFLSVTRQIETLNRVAEETLNKTPLIKASLENDIKDNLRLQSSTASSESQPSRIPNTTTYSTIGEQSDEENKPTTLATLPASFPKEVENEESYSSESVEDSSHSDEISVKREESFITTPKTTEVRPVSKSIRTAYPFLKKIPARLVTSQKPTVNLKSTTTKKGNKKVRSTRATKKPVSNNGLTSSTSRNPEQSDPHHPHGIVVFDKRKRHPKPGRFVNATSATTPSPTSSSAIVIQEETNESSEPEKESSENLVETGEFTNSKPSKIPLSKLAMAMITSSSEFNSGSKTDNVTQYPKTPVNLLYLLQAYTKQLQLASSQKPSIYSVEQPIRIQSTPFMLQLSQLNYAAKLGISFYYSIIAIIPLVYLAFGGLGRLGFLDNFVGKKKRRKRSILKDSYNQDESDYDNRKRFYEKTRTKNFAGNGFHLRRADPGDDDDHANEEKYAWILEKISEIMFEFSMLPQEDEEHHLQTI